MTRLRLGRLFWTGAAAVLVVGALVALAAVLRGHFSETDGRILGTLGALLLAGATLVVGLTLRELGSSPILSGAVVAVAPPGFGLLVYAIWDFVFDGGGDSWRYGWTGALALVAGLMAASARVLARAEALARLAYASAACSAAAASVSAAAIWQRNPGEGMGRAIAALWILAGLGLFLVPVLQRRSGANADDGVRVLASLDDVELVASRGPVEGAPVDTRLRAGERLTLRRR